MVISADSQLGLRISRKEDGILFHTTYADYLQSSANELRSIISEIELKIESGFGDDFIEDEFVPDVMKELDFKARIREEEDKLKPLHEDNSGSYFLITEPVYKAAELVKVGSTYTSRTLKDIKFGTYNYLLGKHQMIRFVCFKGAIKGFYYNDREKVLFEFYYDLELGDYFYPVKYNKEFGLFTKILTFVELGDIEVKVLSPRQSIGSSRENKTTNSTNNTVYVVDSSWNQILIRAQGFAVRGHFKLQPCGPGLADRKLIWVNSFEKNGYTRKPKASIRE